MKRQLVIVFKVVIVAAIVLFLGLAIYHNANNLRHTEFEFSLAPFVLSTLLLMATFVSQALLWQTVLGGVAKPIPASEGVAIWIASQVAKYVPGKVMLPLVRFGLCGRRGIDVGRTTLSIYVELALTMSAAFAMVLACLGWADPATWSVLAHTLRWTGDPAALRWILLPIVPTLLAGVHPRLLQWGINLGLRALKKEPVRIELSYARILVLFLLFAAGWAVYGLSSWLLIRSLGPADPALGPIIAGAFLASYLIGFFSFVTPGGVGVREAVLTGILMLWQFPFELAAVAAAVARLQWTGSELVLSALTLRFRPKPPAEPTT